MELLFCCKFKIFLKISEFFINILALWPNFAWIITWSSLSVKYLPFNFLFLLSYPVYINWKLSLSRLAVFAPALPRSLAPLNLSSLNDSRENILLCIYNEALLSPGPPILRFGNELGSFIYFPMASFEKLTRYFDLINLQKVQILNF